MSPYICLVVDTGKHLVLVDTGADGLGPDTGKLFHHPEVGGISPEDIYTYGGVAGAATIKLPLNPLINTA